MEKAGIFIMVLIIATILIFILLLYRDYKKWIHESKIKSEMSFDLRKLKSLRLYLMAHTDNEEHSECADRIEDLNELIEKIESKI